ncbi:MAG: hypothetical protein ABSH56_25865 [Bryobacteraceae bacterium]
MNRGRLQPLAQGKTSLDFDPDSILKAAPQIKLDVVGRNLREFASAKGFLQMQGSAQVGLVCFLEKLVVSGLKAFAKLSLRLLPVFGKGRFPDKVALAVAVPDPKNLSIVTFEYCTIMFARSCHSPPQI